MSRMTLIAAVVFVSIFTLHGFAWQTERASPPQQPIDRWEYRVLTILDITKSMETSNNEDDNGDNQRESRTILGAAASITKELQSKLNRLGGDGWNLICVEQNAWYFKRPQR